MKKLLLILLLFFPVHGAWAQDFDNKIYEKYQNALYLYDEGKIKEAEKIFKELAILNYGKAHTYMGDIYHNNYPDTDENYKKGLDHYYRGAELGDVCGYAAITQIAINNAKNAAAKGVTNAVKKFNNDSIRYSKLGLSLNDMVNQMSPCMAMINLQVAEIMFANLKPEVFTLASDEESIEVKNRFLKHSFISLMRETNRKLTMEILGKSKALKKEDFNLLEKANTEPSSSSEPREILETLALKYKGINDAVVDTDKWFGPLSPCTLGIFIDKKLNEEERDLCSAMHMAALPLAIAKIYEKKKKEKEENEKYYKQKKKNWSNEIKNVCRNYPPDKINSSSLSSIVEKANNKSLKAIKELIIINHHCRYLPEWDLIAKWTLAGADCGDPELQYEVSTAKFTGIGPIFYEQDDVDVIKYMYLAANSDFNPKHHNINRMDAKQHLKRYEKWIHNEDAKSEGIRKAKEWLKNKEQNICKELK